MDSKIIKQSVKCLKTMSTRKQNSLIERLDENESFYMDRNIIFSH